MSSDLICYIPNHGYADDQLVYVSWLNGYYNIDDPTTNSFKLTDGASGANIEYSSDITEGYVRDESGSGTTEISGLDHLEGKSVKLVSGGEVVFSGEVSSGKILFNDTVYNYVVGIPYTMKIKTTRLELVPAPNTTQGSIKRIEEIKVRYLKSKGGKLGQQYGDKTYLSDLDCEFSKKSKDTSILSNGGFDSDAYVLLQSNEPYPFTLISFMIKLDVMQ